MSLREAFDMGMHMERDWNKQQLLVGYNFALLPVPPRRYRFFRAANMVQVALRENVALTIAPWLDPEDLP